MYEISNKVAYINKNNIFAIYINYNLYFFKGISYKYFNSITLGEFENIPKSFIDFLIKKRILEVKL